MIEVPDQLARAIQAGDCVPWIGAGFGVFAGRPGWEGLLRRLVETTSVDIRPALRDLIEQGRLRTVLSFLHRHFGNEPLVNLLRTVEQEGLSGEVPATLRSFAALPWRACFATTYPDLVRRVFGEGERKTVVLSHTDAHDVSIRKDDDEELLILRTPARGRTMRADGALFDLVEEVVRTRTILFIGFEPDDPDFVQILELIDRIGRGNQHYAVLPFVSPPEAEELAERFAIQVIGIEYTPNLPSACKAIVEACDRTERSESQMGPRLGVLELVRAVRGVPLRTDVALDAALALDGAWLEHLIERFPAHGLNLVPPPTLMRTGCVMWAHRRYALARRCFQQVVSTTAGREYNNLARYNLALCALCEGDRHAALEGLLACAEDDRSFAIVPPRYELLEVQACVGSQLYATARDRGNHEVFEVIVSTLGRPVGPDEHARFSQDTRKLLSVRHPGVCSVRGGFADGRLFGIMSDPIPGFVLADALCHEPQMGLAKVVEIACPLIDGLERCHLVNVFHRNINPHNVVLAASGAKLRGFGIPPIVGLGRPSIRRENLGYQAPEAAEGSASPQTDAYALAAIVYRCLTGRAPQGGVPAPTSLDPRLDPRLDELLREALHPDPNKRAPLSYLRHELNHILATPGLGRAKRLVGTPGADPGRETVVDLTDPRPGPRAAVRPATRPPPAPPSALRTQSPRVAALPDNSAVGTPAHASAGRTPRPRDEAANTRQFPVGTSAESASTGAFVSAAASAAAAESIEDLLTRPHRTVSEPAVDSEELLEFDLEDDGLLESAFEAAGAERYDEALTHAEALLESDVEPNAEQRAAAQMICARAHVALGRPEKATPVLRAIIAHDPAHARARSLLEHIEQLGHEPTQRFQRLWSAIDQQLTAGSPAATEATDAGPEALRSQLVELSKIELNDFGDPRTAVERLSAIAEAAGELPALLHKILDFHTRACAWPRAIEILERLATVHPSGPERAAIRYAGALVLLEHMHKPNLARRWLIETVEADPLHDRGFAACTGALKDARAWHHLTKVLRLRLRALPKQTPVARFVELFSELGNTYEKLNDFKTALAAHDQAAKLMVHTDLPVEQQRAQRMTAVRLAVAVGGDELDKAIDHAHGLIAEAPMDFEIYHRLVELYLKRRNRDRARAVARTLRFLKQADEAELELGDEALHRHAQALGTISREQWRKFVAHPKIDARLSQVFALVWPMIAAGSGRTHAVRGLVENSKLDVSIQSPTPLPRFVAYACRVFDVAVPDLFVDERISGISAEILLGTATEQNAQTVLPTIVAGKLVNTTEAGLKFYAGAAVAKTMPEYVIACTLTSLADLHDILFGATLVVDPDTEAPPGIGAAANGHAENIRAYLPPARLGFLHQAVDATQQPPASDPAAWLQNVYRTADRAGFVLADSLEVAAQIITREGHSRPQIHPKERIRDVVAFSVSEAYFELRSELGFDR